jgi:type II secretory pathway component PulK
MNIKKILDSFTNSSTTYSCNTKKSVFKNRQQGVALITVLIIVFITMAIITSITVINFRTISKLSHQKVRQQAFSALAIGVDFARAGLATSATTSQVDALTDIWANPLPQTKVVGDMEMGGYIIDTESKFNVNNLISSTGNINQNALAQLANLLQMLNIPQWLAYSIAMYIASPPYEAGIMNQYTGAIPAYRPAGRPLIDLSELLYVKGMQQNWLVKLSKYIDVIPKSTNFVQSNNSNNNNQQNQNGGNNSNSSQPSSNSPNSNNNQNNSTSQNQNPTYSGQQTQVNVNTASAEVIAAVSGMPLPIAQRLVVMRAEKPFSSTSEIQSFLASSGIIMSSSSNNINLNNLSVASTYFTVHVIATLSSYEFKWVALLYRPSRNGQWPQVLWQHPE